MRSLALTALSLFVFLLSSTNARAASPCFFISVPCESSPDRGAVTGGAFPAFADMFNLNPASIPTVETPVGIEAIASASGRLDSEPTYNFSIIKGFKRIGAALSSNSENTFYNYNLEQAAQGTQFQSYFGQRSTLNLGSAFALLEDELKQYMSPALGLGARYNQVTGDLDLSFGASLSSKYLSLGVSTHSTRGDPMTGYPNTQTTTLSAEFRLGWLSVDYTLIYYGTSDPIARQHPIFGTPTRIATIGVQKGGFWATAAYRRTVDLDGAERSLLLGSVQYQFFSKLSAGYLYNYVPGSQSLGIQLFI